MAQPARAVPSTHEVEESGSVVAFCETIHTPECCTGRIGEKTSIMQRLCFGGSFNPIHHGHLLCARAAAEAAGFERIVLIPNSMSPLKLGANEVAAPEHRLAMCRLAVEGDDSFAEEVRLRPQAAALLPGGPADGRPVTYQDLHGMARFARVRLQQQGVSSGLPVCVVGKKSPDMVALLPKWHEPDALLKEVDFVVMARPGHPIPRSALPPAVQQLSDNLVGVKQIEISSTEVRSRVMAGKSIRYLVPPAVGDYIARHGLYR